LSNLIEYSDDVAVYGLGRCAEREFDVRIRPVECKKPRKNLAFFDELVIEKHRVSLQHFNGNEIYFPLRRWPNGSRQVDPDTFHMGLAQAYHHETGKQKEHDVDQWNNFDARSFMRNWRCEMHISRILVRGAG
jgi:hypothetical protein